MPNEFKIVSNDAIPAVVNVYDVLYTVQSGSTLVVQKITLCNVLSSQTTASLRVVSSTAHTGQNANQTVNIIKDVPIPSGSSFVIEKMNLNDGDVVQVTSSDASALDVTMHYMEQT